MAETNTVTCMTAPKKTDPAAYIAKFLTAGMGTHPSYCSCDSFFRSQHRWWIIMVRIAIISIRQGMQRILPIELVDEDEDVVDSNS
jgi:hypothetical protein